MKRLLLVLGFLALVGYLATRELGIYTVTSASMEPTLHCASGPRCRALHGDRLLSLSYAFPFRGPRVGDIAIVHLDNRTRNRCGDSTTYVKRIVASPGESVAVDHGRLYVDGVRKEERYVPPAELGGAELARTRLGKGMYLVLGDDRRFSCDSRVFGPVTRNELVARVIAVR